MFGGKIDKGTAPILGGSAIASNPDGAETDLPVPGQGVFTLCCLSRQTAGGRLPTIQFTGEVNMLGRVNGGTWLPAAALLLLTIPLAGCGGGDSSIKASSTTIGQELMDLDASYQKGLITEREYEKAKESILKRYK